MNRTKIEWCEFTWNPVTGCWGPGGTAKEPKRCWYCYAKRMAKRIAYMNSKHFDEYNRRDSWFNDPFQPTFFPDRLTLPARVKKASRIFVCSMGDLFGDWVPKAWIAYVLKTCDENPHHTFIFLTKNPKRYAEWTWGDNCWLGATITNQADADERVPELLQAQAAVRFVSVEPMLGPVDLRCNNCEGDGHLMIHRPGEILNHPEPCTVCKKTGFLVDWLILGAMTGPGSKAHQPDPAWVQSLIDQGRAAGIPVFLKDNLHWPEKIQEFPKCT